MGLLHRCCTELVVQLPGYWQYLVPPSVAVVSLYALYRFMCWRNRHRVQGKTVLITGASSGIGKSCAKIFYDNGARVILASRNEASLQKVKEEIHTGTGLEPGVVAIDMSDYGSIRVAAQKVLKDYKNVDILINNAGQSFRGATCSTDINVHEQIMKVNYFGQIVLTQELLPSMIKNGGGAVVAVSSIQGKVAVPYRSAYGASKHALECYFDILRAEHYDDKIRVLICCPSYVKTPLSLKALKDDGSHYGKMDEDLEAGMSPEYVADQILGGIEYDSKHVILGPIHHEVACYMGNVLWNIMARIMRRKARKDKLRFGSKNKSE